MQACEKEAREKNIALHELQRPVVNQNTPVAQALKMVKSEIQRKQKENAHTSTMGGKQMPKRCCQIHKIAHMSAINNIGYLRQD